jgi:DMSO/TMAO reductase YedYZ molybdopterin-dependent catalytic subunit
VRIDVGRRIVTREDSGSLRQTRPREKRRAIVVTTKDIRPTDGRAIGGRYYGILAVVRWSRRQLIGSLAAGGLGTLVDPGPVLALLAADVPCTVAESEGTLEGTLPLFRGRSMPQAFGVKFGGVGLDARLVTDLSALAPDRLITPNELAYIRTEIPAEAAARKAPWLISGTGPIAGPRSVTFDELEREARPMGPHLFECSGNSNPADFGLMSVANWDGVPLVDVVSRLKPGSGATAVLVKGIDHELQRSQRSASGASWVFPLASLDSLGAFLATRMNGQPVPPDHGSPVRLAVPGWYGCSWIKWVDEIRLVGPDEPATSQMLEFAGRTHQRAQHPLAKDFAPADIQTAATPIRVEARRTLSGLEYRIVGIVWGGTRPVDRLEIRCGPNEGWKPFSVCPTPKTHRIWSLWEYRWRPPAPGVYDITLRVADPSVPQRRLTSGYYMRQVRIIEI